MQLFFGYLFLYTIVIIRYLFLRAVDSSSLIASRQQVVDNFWPFSHEESFTFSVFFQL